MSKKLFENSLKNYILLGQKVIKGHGIALGVSVVFFETACRAS
jgi:hypothetical protein